MTISQTYQVAKYTPSSQALSEINQVFIKLFLFQKVLEELRLVSPKHFFENLIWNLIDMLVRRHEIKEI